MKTRQPRSCLDSMRSGQISPSEMERRVKWSSSSGGAVGESAVSLPVIVGRRGSRGRCGLRRVGASGVLYWARSFDCALCFGSVNARPRATGDSDRALSGRFLLLSSRKNPRGFGAALTPIRVAASCMSCHGTGPAALAHCLQRDILALISCFSLSSCHHEDIHGVKVASTLRLLARRSQGHAPRHAHAHPRGRDLIRLIGLPEVGGCGSNQHLACPAPHAGENRASPRSPPSSCHNRVTLLTPYLVPAAEAAFAFDDLELLYGWYSLRRDERLVVGSRRVLVSAGAYGRRTRRAEPRAACHGATAKKGGLGNSPAPPYRPGGLARVCATEDGGCGRPER